MPQAVAVTRQTDGHQYIANESRLIRRIRRRWPEPRSQQLEVVVKRRSPATASGTSAHWWTDAVGYQVYLRSFARF